MRNRKLGATIGFLIAVSTLTLAVVDAARAAGTDPAMQAFEERTAKLELITRELSMKSTAGEMVFASDFEAVAQASCTSDRDADRLSDCVETNTGTFVSATDTGTSPDASDTDGDGLLDGDEVLGTSAGLNLPGLGASALRRDLLIEYDWFDDAQECAPHSHRPSAAAMARAAQMFAQAPVQNPDGSTGINLIQDYGQGGAFDGGNLVTGHDAVLPGTFDATHAQIKQANHAAKRTGYFHYVLLAHRYGGGLASSGFAEIVGDDVIVSLYCYGTDINVGNTIAHELGHNLGLDHGGFEACNGKPNYNSIMNYRYQFEGVDTQCNATGLDNTANFSVGDRLELDEGGLDEPQGVCGSQPVDWNGNGSLESGLQFDLNSSFASICGSALSRMRDFDDWNNLTFLGVMEKHGVLKSIQTEVGCAGAPVPE